MPKRGAIATVLTIAALVLLLNFKTPTVEDSRTLATGDTTPAIVEAAPTAPNAVTEDAVATEPPTATSQPQATDPPAAIGSGTVEGATVQTRFGPVQVAVTIESGEITNVTALQLPADDRHSLSISQNVEPILREAALEAQSASIDIVSGATYTSVAYARSLQSALDQLDG